MAIALILISVALVVCLYLLLMGNPNTQASGRIVNAERSKVSGSAEDSASPKSAGGDFDKKRKELEELKVTFAELKEELKTAKKKLFDQKEEGKAGEDLSRARAEVERQASTQLENTRAELSQALAEIEKMKGGEGKGPRRSAAPTTPAPNVATVPVAVAAAPKVIRELSDSDRERITRAEADAAKARQRIADLEKAMKNSKGRGDAATHQLKVSQQEAALARDKFRAVERRLNRLMLERDLMLRAIKDLETKSGITADRVELTADEAADSDQRVNEKQVAEAKSEEDSRHQLEANETTAAPSSEDATQTAIKAAALVPPAQA